MLNFKNDVKTACLEYWIFENGVLTLLKNFKMMLKMQKYT